jgi:molybdopterin-biosynthesis enzyme MoeA-like protein
VSRDVAIVVVGDEILQGRRMEANAAWLARELFAMGVPLAEVRIVSDIPGALVAAVRQLSAPGRTLICTGGLGPTRDDRTRAEAAEVFGRNLVRSEEALSQVAERRGLLPAGRHSRRCQGRAQPGRERPGLPP